jgi:membrane-associated phospholipid phosphatase/beta-phosphoglucomutase-like phosphatase (HAD superfamily)
MAAPERLRPQALLVAAAAGAAFVALTVVVLTHVTAGWDQAVRDWMPAHRVAPLTRFFLAATRAGAWYLLGPIVLVAAAWLYRRGLPRAAALVAVGTLASWALNVALKQVIRRPQPGNAWEIAHASQFAFPSGHTMSTTAFVTIFALVLCTTVLAATGGPDDDRLRRRRIAVVVAAVAWAVLIGVSRIYLGVHWGTDVIGGWLAGTAFGLAAWALWYAPQGETAPKGVADATDAGEGVRDTAGAARAEGPAIRVVLFDWGNTLMVDDGQPGAMADWPRVAAVPGAAEALAALLGRYRLCVATNADDSGAEKVMTALGRVGLARFIERVFSSRDLGARKPDPAFYAAVLDALQADAVARDEPPLCADQVVMVGDDYENDVVGACAAGLEAIWFNPARTPLPGNRSASDVEVKALTDLPSVLSRDRQTSASTEGRGSDVP